MRIKSKEFFALLAYKVGIDVTYNICISKLYSYQGFICSLSLYRVVVGALIALVMIRCAVRMIERNKPLDIVLFFLIIAYFVPNETLYAFQNQNEFYHLFVLLYFVVLMIAYKISYKYTISASDHTSKGVNFGERGFVIIVAASAILCIILSGIYSGFRINLNIAEFYDYRYEAREYNMPTVLTYLYTWAKVIMPIGMGYAIIRRKPLMITWTVFAQLLNVAFEGKKSLLFMMAISAIISLLYKKESKRYICYSMCGIQIASLIEVIASNKSFSIIANYFTRRVLLLPCLLGSDYFDYFSNHELDFLRQSILRYLGFTSPYSELSIQRTIGQFYYGNSASNCNTGLCGDAFSNFGWMSLLLYPIMIIIALLVLNRCLNNVDERIKMIVCISVMYSFINGAFFTVMLTNGFIMLCYLMKYFKTNEYNTRIMNVKTASVRPCIIRDTKI